MLVYYSHCPAAHCHRFCHRHRRRRRRRRSCSFDRRPDGFVRFGQATPMLQRSPPSEFSRAVASSGSRPFSAVRDDAGRFLRRPTSPELPS